MSRTIATLVSISILVLILFTPSFAADYQVRLKSRTFTPAETKNVTAELNQYAGRHVLVQLHETPNQTDRKDLANQGIHLLKSISGNTWLAGIDQKNFSQGKAPLPLRWIGALEPSDKIAADIKSGNLHPHSLQEDGRRVLVVAMHRDVAERTGREVLINHGLDILDYAKTLNLFTVAAPINRVNSIAVEDAVNWIGETALPLGPLNDIARKAVGADIANEPPYSVTGQGVNAFVLDGGSVPDGASVHPDLAGRVTVAGLPIPDMIGHPSHVSCTVGGDGTASGGQYKGMAPDVQIISSSVIPGLSFPPMYDKPSNIENAYQTAIQTHGATVANNSIGSNLAQFGKLFCDKEGDYEQTAMLVDEIVGETFGRITIVWANGNERGNNDGDCGNAYYTTAPPSTAKNPIAVGAVNKDDLAMTEFSSWGPTDDGRLKPDVSAPGCASGDGGIKSCTGALSFGDYWVACGTSMACPVVTGSVALLQEYWRRQIGGDDPRASTVKALLIHGSLPVGSDGPDFKFGYGILDVPATLDLVDDAIIIEDVIDQGEIYGLTLEPTGDPIKVTLAWTDPAGGHLAEKVLVNDLDLTLSDGPGETLPWILDPENPANDAVRGENHRDPVEQVEAPSGGQAVYELTVTGTEIPEGPQAFSLVITGLREVLSDDDDETTGDDDDVTDDDDTMDDDDVTDDGDDEDGDGCCG